MIAIVLRPDSKLRDLRGRPASFDRGLHHYEHLWWIFWERTKRDLAREYFQHLLRMEHLDEKYYDD